MRDSFSRALPIAWALLALACGSSSQNGNSDAAGTGQGGASAAGTTATGSAGAGHGAAGGVAGDSSSLPGGGSSGDAGDSSAQAGASDGGAAGAANADTPAGLLGGLAGWHLTLPTGPSNAATEIDQPELASYSDAYFAVMSAPPRVRFVALFGGARTSTGTAFARSELRQEYAGPGALGSKDWPCASSIHALHVRQSIVATPLHKPEMSIGQIHDASNDLLELRYIGPEDSNGIGTGDGVTDTGTIEAHFNDDSSFQVLDAAYRVGDTMIVDVKTDGAGNMSVSYENLRTGVAKQVSQAFYASVSGGCYFKAGNYHQACTKIDVNGKTNAACVAKKWPSGRYEADPNGQSILDLFELNER